MIQNNYKYPSQQKPDMKEEFLDIETELKFLIKYEKCMF